MKKVFILIIIMGSLTGIYSCTDNDKNDIISNEEKMAKLIKEEMFKTLYDFESYEAIETSKPDSAFSTIHQDSIVIAHAMTLMISLESAEKLFKKIDQQLNTIEIWGDSYTDRARDKVNEAREELQNLSNELEILETVIEKGKDEIIKRHNDFTPNFIGWSAIHRFRCKTKGGHYDIGRIQYTFDRNFEKILYSIDLESEEQKEINSLIDYIINDKETTENRKIPQAMLAPLP